MEKANSKFNESIAQNKVMREDIDNLRKEKVIFENVYTKLENQLGGKRRDVANIIEVANSSYEERDKVQEKLATLISQSEKEQAEFTKEIKAVQDLIDKDDQMQNKIKLNIQMNQVENTKVHGFTQSIANSEKTSNQGRQSEADQRLKDAVKEVQMDPRKNKSAEEVFTKIMAATGITDIGVLVQTFIQAEEKNFALFKFVNELNQEIENYETQIFEMQSEIDRNLAEGGQDSQKRKQVKELEKKLAMTNEEINQMEKEQKWNLVKIKKIKECISKISKVVDTDETLNQDLLGHQGITESNMFVYMGMVEQRINEILQAYAYIQARRNAGFLFDEPTDVAKGIDDPEEAGALKDIQRQQEQIMMPGIF